MFLNVVQQRRALLEPLEVFKKTRQRGRKKAFRRPYPATTTEALKSPEVRLSLEQVHYIEACIPPVGGTRSDERQMKVLDSER